MRYLVTVLAYVAFFGGGGVGVSGLVVLWYCMLRGVMECGHPTPPEAESCPKK